jgi:hypothetical protein
MGDAFATELAEVLAVDVSTLSVAEFAEHMGRVEQLRTRFEAQVYERLDAFERSAAWQLDAAYSPANWLAAQTGTARAAAGRRMKLVAWLRQMPHTREALADGSITESHAQVLSRCVANPRTREVFPDHEVDLVVEAAESTADELAQHVAEWIELWDMDGAEPRDPQHDVLNANRVGDRVKVNGDFGLDTGLPLLAALEERCDQLFHRDKKVSEVNPDDGLGTRTPGNRRAEALVELVAAGSAAKSNPDRREPLFNIHIDEDTFLFGGRHADTMCELDDGAVVPMDALALLRCGSRYQDLVLDASRAVLFLGREERYANRAQRRAWPHGTAGARCRAATGPRPSATPTTSSGGSTTGPPTSTASCSCAATTTAWSTRAPSRR